MVKKDKSQLILLPVNPQSPSHVKSVPPVSGIHNYDYDASLLHKSVINFDILSLYFIACTPVQLHSTDALSFVKEPFFPEIICKIKRY